MTKHLTIERQYTRDARIPVSADDPKMESGWECHPVPPTRDPRWVIFDSSGDYKTGWCRLRAVENVPEPLTCHNPDCRRDTCRIGMNEDRRSLWAMHETDGSVGTCEYWQKIIDDLITPTLSSVREIRENLG